MIYLYLDRNTIKLLYLKKTLLGQQETLYNQKTYESNLFEKGEITNVDLLASAVKEVVSSSNRPVAENQISLILPQEFFSFFRTTVPSDIAPSALNSFISDKARSILPVDNNDLVSGYFFDSCGLIDDKKISTKYSEEDKIADVLKAKIEEINNDKKKVNRI